LVSVTKELEAYADPFDVTAPAEVGIVNAGRLDEAGLPEVSLKRAICGFGGIGDGDDDCQIHIPRSDMCGGAVRKLVDQITRCEAAD
jgi:hypothetical protein